MGEIADDIIDGVYYQVCGEYVGFETGCPVTCDGCLGEDEGWD